MIQLIWNLAKWPTSYWVYGINFTMTHRGEPRGLAPWARNIGLVVMAPGNRSQGDLDLCPALLGVNYVNWLRLVNIWGMAHLLFHGHKGQLVRKESTKNCEAVGIDELNQYTQHIHVTRGRASLSVHEHNCVQVSGCVLVRCVWAVSMGPLRVTH